VVIIGIMKTVLLTYLARIMLFMSEVCEGIAVLCALFIIHSSNFVFIMKALTEEHGAIQ
jgi:hypothetical protein